jgi:hypothetical protein
VSEVDALKDLKYRYYMPKPSPSCRYWNKIAFDKYAKKKKWYKHFVEMTEGVYRFEPLGLDIYPSTLWGRKYKTGEKLTIQGVLDELELYFKGQSDDI